MTSGDCSIFISHATVDEEIALSLKNYIVKALPAEIVFVSSDPEDLTLGDQWVPKVLRALQSARIVLVLATPRGLSRKWVWFEAGRTWFSNIKLIPCCLGELRKNDLPLPFSNFTSANIDDARDVELLFTLLRELFGEFSETIDYDLIAREIARVGGRAEEKNKVLEDPFSENKMKDIHQQMTVLNPAQRETIKQYVIYGELTTGGAKSRTKVTGVNMDQWSVPQYLADLTGWLIPKPGNTPYDNMQQNSFTINPEIRPLLQTYFSQTSKKVT